MAHMAAQRPLITVTLTEVREVAFNRSELSMLDSLPKASREALANTPYSGAVCFVSKLGNQLRFVWHENEADPKRTGGGRRATMYANLRLDSGTWSGEMLGEYARRVGLHLVGIKSYTEWYEDNRKRKREKKRGS
jgi:hypothetical protein